MTDIQKRLFCVITVARQIDGEFVFVKTEKAFNDQDKAEIFSKTLHNQFYKGGKPTTVMLKTDHGDVGCYCDVGVFDVEVE